MYHTSLGAKPMRRSFKFDGYKIRLVSNIHVTLLIGYDKDNYYYIDPLWSHISKGIVFPAIIPNSKQIIKIKNQKWNEVLMHQAVCVYILNLITKSP